MDETLCPSYLSPGNPPIDPASFKPSCITVVDGTSGMVPAVLFHLCAASSAFGREAIFLDGWNSFDPYAVSRIARSFGAKQETLSHIHIARAFTKYQMDALIGNLEDALGCGLLPCWRYLTSRHYSLEPTRGDY